MRPVHVVLALLALVAVAIVAAAVLAALHDDIPAFFPQVAFAALVGAGVGAPTALSSDPPTKP